MTENVREMTFDEEYEILEKEKEELFAMEKEDCEPPFANCVVRRALRCIRKLFSEIQQHRAIGTVEECQTAMERMKPRKPKESKMWNLMLCPNCGNNVMVKEKTVFRLKYCCNCGQAIDWSE